MECYVTADSQYLTLYTTKLIHIHPSLIDPCGSSGKCTNTRGLFKCDCSGGTGNRCQYPSSCMDDSCSDRKMCLESLLAPLGHVCIAPDVTVLLRVTEVLVDPGFLSELLVNYREALLQVYMLTYIYII